MNLKKFFILLLACILVFVTCVSCSSNVAKEGTTTKDSTTAKDDAKEPAAPQTSNEPLKLSVLGRQRTGITFEQVKTINAWDVLMDMFAENNLKLDFTIAERDQYKTVLNAALAAGEVDGLFHASVLSNADRVNLIERGLVMNIDDALKYSDGTAAKEFSDTGLYYVSRQVNTYVDGGMYYFGNVSKQISVEKDIFGPHNPISNNNWCMLIRKDWLDKLGLPMPQTLDEFFNCMVAFQTNDMNGNGEADERIALYPKFDTGIAQWFGLTNHYFQFNRATGKVDCPFLQEGFIPYVNFLKKCIDADIIRLGDDCKKNNDGSNANDVDKLMMADALSAFFFLADIDYPNTPSHAEYVIMPPIQGVEGVEPVMTGSYGYKSWSSWAFSSKADPKAVAAFLDTICTKDYAVWVTFGIEGETYKVDPESGLYTFTASNNYDDILRTKIGRGYMLVIDSILPDASQIGWYQQYYGLLNWNSYDDFVNSRYFNEVVVPSKTERQISNLKEYCKQVDRLFLYNMNGDTGMFAPMNTLEEAEILEQYESELTTYMDELLMGLLTGTYNVSDMDQYIKEMNSLGLQKVLGVRQAQLDRFLNP